MSSGKLKGLLRLGGAALVASGGALITAYFIRWWPYTHREDFQFSVLSSDGSSYVASGIIPLPFVPCLLVGVGVALWLVSLFGRLDERRP